MSALDESRESEIRMLLELANWLAWMLELDEGAEWIIEVVLESTNMGSVVSLDATGRVVDCDKIQMAISKNRNSHIGTSLATGQKFELLGGH